MENIIQPVVAKYGWTVKTNGKQCELFNRHGFKIVIVTAKRDRFHFRDVIGQLLYSAVDLAKGTEKVLTEGFFAKPL